jgi:hypothetical protein
MCSAVGAAGVSIDGMSLSGGEHGASGRTK